MFNFIGRWIDNLIYKLLKKHPMVESAFSTYGVSTDDTVQFEKNPVLTAALHHRFKLVLDNKIFQVIDVHYDRDSLTVMHIESQCCFEIEKTFFDQFMVPADPDTGTPGETA